MEKHVWSSKRALIARVESVLSSLYLTKLSRQFDNITHWIWFQSDVPYMDVLAKSLNVFAISNKGINISAMKISAIAISRQLFSNVWRLYALYHTLRRINQPLD